MTARVTSSTSGKRDCLMAVDLMNGPTQGMIGSRFSSSK